MIILGIILSVFAIAFFCWLLFTLAVYALPFYTGLMAAFMAYHHGYGVLGSGLIAVSGLAAARVPLARRAFGLQPTIGFRPGAARTWP